MKLGAIEAGGTKFVVCIGDENGNVLERDSFPTETPEKTLANIFKFFVCRKYCSKTSVIFTDMPMLPSLLTLRCGPVGLATLAIKWLWGQKMGNSCHIIHCLHTGWVAGNLYVEKLGYCIDVSLQCSPFPATHILPVRRVWHSGHP